MTDPDSLLRQAPPVSLWLVGVCIFVWNTGHWTLLLCAGARPKLTRCGLCRRRPWCIKRAIVLSARQASGGAEGPRDMHLLRHIKSKPLWTMFKYLCHSIFLPTKKWAIRFLRSMAITPCVVLCMWVAPIHNGNGLKVSPTFRHYYDRQLI